MLKKALLAAVAVLIATSGTALAHSNEARLKEQKDWINHGRKTGEITWREGRKLRREQNYIVARKYELQSDGWLSKRDRRELHALQNDAAQHITHEANDGWRRPWWLPRVGR